MRGRTTRPSTCSVAGYLQPAGRLREDRSRRCTKRIERRAEQPRGATTRWRPITGTRRIATSASPTRRRCTIVLNGHRGGRQGARDQARLHGGDRLQEPAAPPPGAISRRTRQAAGAVARGRQLRDKATELRKARRRRVAPVSADTTVGSRPNTGRLHDGPFRPRERPFFVYLHVTPRVVIVTGLRLRRPHVMKNCLEVGGLSGPSLDGGVLAGVRVPASAQGDHRFSHRQSSRSPEGSRSRARA